MVLKQVGHSFNPHFEANKNDTIFSIEDSRILFGSSNRNVPALIIDSLSNNISAHDIYSSIHHSEKINVESNVRIGHPTNIQFTEDPDTLFEAIGGSNATVSIKNDSSLHCGIDLTSSIDPEDNLHTSHIMFKDNETGTKGFRIMNNAKPVSISSTGKNLLSIPEDGESSLQRQIATIQQSTSTPTPTLWDHYSFVSAVDGTSVLGFVAQTGNIHVVRYDKDGSYKQRLWGTRRRIFSEGCRAR